MSKATRRGCFRRVNLERHRNGLKPLVWSPLLAKSAQAAAKEAHRDRGPLRHVSGWFKRIYKKLGRRRFGEVGECLAEGQSSYSTVVDMWHDSQAHYLIMNDKDVTHGGIGHYGRSWCLHTAEMK